MKRRLNDASPEEWTDAIRRNEGAGVWDEFFINDDTVDPVNKPAHYNNGKYETIDVIVDTLGEWEAISYCHGNVLKYTIRLWNKGNPIQDAEKAKWYLNKMIELMHKTKGGNW